MEYHQLVCSVAVAAAAVVVATIDTVAVSAAAKTVDKVL